MRRGYVGCGVAVWLARRVRIPPGTPPLVQPTLHRQNTEISKQIFPEKEYRALNPNFHIHTSVSDFYIPTIGLPILL